MNGWNMKNSWNFIRNLKKKMNKKSNVKVMSNFETCWDDPNEKEEEEEIENENEKKYEAAISAIMQHWTTRD